MWRTQRDFFTHSEAGERSHAGGPQCGPLSWQDLQAIYKSTPNSCTLPGWGSGSPANRFRAAPRLQSMVSREKELLSSCLFPQPAASLGGLVTYQLLGPEWEEPGGIWCPHKLSSRPAGTRARLQLRIRALARKPSSPSHGWAQPGGRRLASPPISHVVREGEGA